MLPSGTVTFLMTDIEESSARWEIDAPAMRAAIAGHDAIVTDVVDAHGGVIVKHLGDGCWAAFGSAPAAVRAAIDFQQRIQTGPWQFGERLKVRIGLHTGTTEPTEGDYFGPVPNRAARVADLANGDQIVCSTSTAHLLEGIDLRSEGMHELRGIGVEEVFMILDGQVHTDQQPLRRALAPSSLPRTHTSFVGRDHDIDTVQTFLTNGGSVVTLVGPGGVGKTRLAVEVGLQLREHFRAGIFFCDLAAISDPESLTEAVADAVGAKRQPGMDLVESIADYLIGRQALLVIDNCEHVHDAARTLVGRLQDVDSLRVLATSREPLHLMGEQIVAVSPLAPETFGAELFVQRARQSDPTFGSIEGDDVHLRELVQRIDGIPLAIELAAAWARVMTPEKMVARLADGVAMLHDDHRVARHVTLYDTVAWSYELLPRAEAALFDRMSVFAGGCTLEAVEAVCVDAEVVRADEVPRLVMALVDKSMIVSRSDGGERRFSMLETLRTFGRDQLDASSSGAKFRRRHADYFREFAVLQNERIFSPAEADAWRVLDGEWANLRTAFDELTSDQAIEAAAELVSALVWFATFSMRFELYEWATELLETPDIEQLSAYTDLCGAAAFRAYFTVDGDVTELAARGLAASSSDKHGFCRTALAAVFLNNLHSAETSEALTSAWLASSPTEIGSRLWAEAFRTFHLCSQDPSPIAAQHAAATARIADETGSLTARGVAAWAEGQVVSLENLERGIDVWTEGLEWPRSLPGEHLVEQLLTGLILHFGVGRDDEVVALRRCQDALRRALDAHYLVGASHLLGPTAIALSRAGDAETGARLVGAMMGNGHLPRPNARRALERALGTKNLDPHFAPGAHLGVTSAVHIALDALEAAIALAGEVQPTSAG